MLNKKLSLLSCLLFGILFCIVPVMASAAFPEKAVTMIIPFDAGGASDIVGRKLAQVAEKYLGQTIIIVNRPGGSGATGYAETMQAKPDGYTVCAALSTIVIHKVMGTLPQGHDAFDIIGAYNFDPGAKIGRAHV